MDRYRIAPARPVCLSAAGAGVHLRSSAAVAPAGRRSGAAEIGIFTAERYFSAADVGRRDAAMIPAPTPAVPDREHELPPRLSVPSSVATDVASQSGRTVASSEASWNSRSGLLSAASARQQQQQQQHTAGSIGAGSGSDHGHRGRRPGGGGSAHRWTLFGRECPCAGRKAVTVDVASSEPRSPATTAHFDAKFSPQCAVEECLESAIFKVKHPSPSPSPPRAAAAKEEEEREPTTKVKVVTVTPGSRAFPLAAAADVPFTAALSNPDIDRRVLSSGGFTFPALGAARVVTGGGILDEPPRLSLEVFRPIDEDSVMLSDPPPPTAVPLAAGRVVVAALVDEEAMSDASSDLFDLESFAAASSSYPTTYRGRGSRRNSADDDDDDDLPYVSSAAAAAGAEPALSECMYPASEASVVWSVVTAEGGGAPSVANFSSAASACCVDDLRYVVVVPADESPDEAGFTAAMSRSARRKKSGGGFLSSCRCEKAVSVGPTPVRVVRPPPPHAGAAAAAKRSGDAASRYHHHGRAHVPVRT